MPDQTEPGFPTPSAPARGPVGDAEAMAEIKSMKSDPTHELYKAWKEKGASHPEIAKLYKRAFGTGEIDGPNAPANQSDQTTSIFLSSQSDIEGANPEKEKALADLKTLWGADFGGKLEAAGVGTEFFIENNPEMDMGLGNDPKILDALAVIGARINERKGRK